MNLICGYPPGDYPQRVSLKIGLVIHNLELSERRISCEHAGMKKDF